MMTSAPTHTRRDICASAPRTSKSLRSATDGTSSNKISACRTLQKHQCHDEVDRSEKQRAARGEVFSIAGTSGTIIASYSIK